MSLSDNFFCFSASFRLRLSSSRRFLFSSSLCRFFSSSLLLLSSLFSSLILCKKRCGTLEKILHIIQSNLWVIYFVLIIYLFDFLPVSRFSCFWCTPTGVLSVWLKSMKGGEKWRQVNRSSVFFWTHIDLNLDSYGTVPMSSLVLASISPSRVSGLAIDFSSSQE